MDLLPQKDSIATNLFANSSYRSLSEQVDLQKILFKEITITTVATLTNVASNFNSSYEEEENEEGNEIEDDSPLIIKEESTELKDNVNSAYFGQLFSGFWSLNIWGK
jgi:hypothetical protein